MKYDSETLKALQMELETIQVSPTDVIKVSIEPTHISYEDFFPKVKGILTKVFPDNRIIFVTDKVNIEIEGAEK